MALAALNMGEALILTLIEKGILSREDALLLIANAREAKQLHAAEHRLETSRRRRLHFIRD
ncbi:MAG: hypothetical protein JO249_19110 [Acidobacteria bacterium]|nr:hypothetical protein [Acidobacteriota bacterium]